jgi:ABC-type sugar transport system ATPase subunit
LYAHPANVFVAGFVGQPAMNLLAASLEQVRGERRLRFVGTEATLALPTPLPASRPGATERLCVGWRPEALRLCDPGDARTLVSGTVRVVELLGPERLIYIETDLTPWDASDAPQHPASVIVRTPSDAPTLRVDERVGLLARPEEAHLFGADGRCLEPSRDGVER